MSNAVGTSNAPSTSDASSKQSLPSTASRIQSTRQRITSGTSNTSSKYSLPSTASGIQTSTQRIDSGTSSTYSTSNPTDFTLHYDDLLLELSRRPPYEKQTIPELLDELETRETFGFVEMMAFYSMDAASRFFFSETLACLRSGSGVENMIGTVRERFLHWGRWSSLPSLEQLIYRNPITLHLPRTTSNMVKLAATEVQTRVTELNKGSDGGGGRAEKNDELLP